MEKTKDQLKRQKWPPVDNPNNLPIWRCRACNWPLAFLHPAEYPVKVEILECKGTCQTFTHFVLQ